MHIGTGTSVVICFTKLHHVITAINCRKHNSIVNITWWEFVTTIFVSSISIKYKHVFIPMNNLARSSDCKRYH